jgi:mannose-6-phosphate isomerase-like protein (cupin superfamily)
MHELAPYVAHERDSEVERWEGIVAWRTLLSGDRSPSAGLTVGIAEIEPGASHDGALHQHAEHEAYYFIAGHGAVHLDGVEHGVEPGSVVFVPGGTEHFVRNTGTEELRFLYVFAADRFSDVVYRFPGDAADA